MELDNRDVKEMKEQLAALQRKIDSQTEINDRMIRNALRSSVDKLERINIMAMVLCIFALFFVEGILYYLEASTGFLIATGVFLGVNAIVGYCIKFGKSRLDCSQDLVTTARKALKFKENHRKSLLYEMPFLMAWVAWYIKEAAVSLGAEDTRDFVMLAIVLLFGAAVGGVIGYFRFYRPAIREADNIISQIDELR